MAIEKGDRVERAARCMFVGALALASIACGSEQHSSPEASAGHANAGAGAGLGGSAGADDVSASGAGSDGGETSDGGEPSNAGDAGNTGDAGATSEGGRSGFGGTGGDVGTAGGGTANLGGSGGTSSGGTSSGGTNSAGTDVVAGTGGTTSGAGGTGGTGTTAGQSSGGADSGGIGGTNAGGTDAGGTSSGGGNSGGADTAGGPSVAGASGGIGGGPAVCGDAVLASAEECDDGNTKSLDGCSAGCRYEVVDRLTSMSLQNTAAPSFCTPTTNALGRAFSSPALTTVNSLIQQSINSGELNNLVLFNGLEDPTGASDDSSLTLGFLPGFFDTGNGPWPSGSPLDLWFRTPATSVDAQGVPLVSLSGSLASRTLAAGPGSLTLPLALGSGLNTLAVSNANLRATVNGTPAPSVPAPPPANVSPSLKVFQSITASGSGQGVCGNVTVESLAVIPVPAALASTCMACTGSRTYKACPTNTVEPGCNSILDVMVGGCKTLGCFVTVATPTQPDVPAPGSSGVKALSLDSTNAVPSSQSAANHDAYSSYFKFDANRTHVIGVQ